MKKVIIIALVIGVAITIAIFGKNYYDNRYVGQPYYTVVPAGYDTTLQPARDQNGKDVSAEYGKEVDYNLTAYNDKGEAKEVSVNYRGDNPPQPGTYMYVNASKDLVVDWKVIPKSDVPAEALKKLDQN